ncbi:MAG: hypothetical protein WBQ94_30355 [Terracidiphilus sp.]
MQDYASPLEVLFSRDGKRLYVLCQQSEEVRVLDATTFPVIGKIAVAEAPRVVSLSALGDRFFVTNSSGDTLSAMDEHARAIVMLDRDAAHLAEQLALKAFVPVVVLSSDKKLSSTIIPCIFRLPSETSLAARLHLLETAAAAGAPIRSC